MHLELRFLASLMTAVAAPAESNPPLLLVVCTSLFKGHVITGVVMRARITILRRYMRNLSSSNAQKRLTPRA